MEYINDEIPVGSKYRSSDLTYRATNTSDDLTYHHP